MFDEEEKKKREEEAKLIISSNSIGDTINSINYANSNNYKINTNNDNEKEFINRINEANSIINSINPRQNVAAPSVSEEDSIKSRETAAEFLKAIDNNANNNIQNTSKIQEIEEQPEASESAREAVNVLINKKKLSSYTTEDEKLQQQSVREQQVKRMEETNADKNPLSQLGKAIENFWLGITSGGKSAAYYATNTNHTKEQENELLANNKGGIANLEYKAQLNNPDLSLIKNNNTAGNNPLIYQKSTLANTSQDNTLDFIRDEDKQRIDKELDEHKDAFGELELNHLRRELSNSILEDQNKIADNINRIDNRLIKKIAELTPSAGNSFAGAGLSVINQYLGMSYFIVSASGSYEFDGRNRGMSKEEARAYGSIMGFVEGATEYLEVSHFMPAQTKAIRTGSAIKFLKNVGLDMADNAVQEAIIDPIDEFIASSISGKGNYDLKTREGWKQLGNAMVEDAINGALSSILMGGINLNIGSCMKLYDNIKNGKSPTTNEWKAAFSDVQKSKKINIKEKFKEAFKYEKEKVTNNHDVYTMTDMDNHGNIIGLTQTIGESIDLDNKELQVFPVVVYTDGYYNIIDGKSGLKLDTTLYENKQHAINGFKEKISNADIASINEINRQAVITQLVVADKFREMQEIAQQNPGEMQRQTRIEFVQDDKMYSTNEAQQILNDYGIDTSVNNRQYLGQELNDMITYNMFEKLQLNETSKNNSNYMQNNKNNTRKSYTPEQFNKAKELLNEISDTSIYKKSDTIPILEYLKDNIGNVNLIEQSGNYYVNSLSEDGKVVYQQKVSDRPYTGKKLKEIINTAIEKADYNVDFEKPNTNTAQTSSEPNRSTFYSTETNYSVKDIKKVTEPFNMKQEYTIDEMAEIWNNEIAENEYDVVYDSNGNIKSYIAIEEDGGNLVANQYDSKDDIVKSEIIPDHKGKYTSKAIKNTIEKVSSLYDENRPIKGQQDIEDNEVRSMKKNNRDTTSTTTNNQVSVDSRYYL